MNKLKEENQKKIETRINEDEQKKEQVS